MVRFATKLPGGSSMSNSANTKTITSISKPTTLVATIYIPDNECLVISTDANMAVLSAGKIGNLFQDTSSEEELNDE